MPSSLERSLSLFYGYDFEKIVSSISGRATADLAARNSEAACSYVYRINVNKLRASNVYYYLSANLDWTYGLRCLDD